VIPGLACLLAVLFFEEVLPFETWMGNITDSGEGYWRLWLCLASSFDVCSDTCVLQVVGRRCRFSFLGSVTSFLLEVHRRKRLTV
jgi:hypothetical protein